MQRAARQAVAQPLPQGKHILLRNVPRSATKNDMQKLISVAGLTAIQSAAIQYNSQMQPIGQAVLSLSLPTLLRDNMRALEMSQMGGHVLQASPAVRRGCEPDESGTHVVISGTAGKVTPAEIKTILCKGYELHNERPVQVIPKPAQLFTLCSRFRVRFASEEEAQRFVMHNHRTLFGQNIIQTHVVWSEGPSPI